jgi:hypothetical protein
MIIQAGEHTAQVTHRRSLQKTHTHFELCDLLPFGCHPGQDITRQQTQSELVRVMENNRVIDPQIKRGGRGDARGHRMRNI